MSDFAWWVTIALTILGVLGFVSLLPREEHGRRTRRVVRCIAMCWAGGIVGIAIGIAVDLFGIVEGVFSPAWVHAKWPLVGGVVGVLLAIGAQVYWKMNERIG